MDDPGQKWFFVGPSKSGLPWTLEYGHVHFFLGVGRIRWYLLPASIKDASKVIQAGTSVNKWWKHWPGQQWEQLIKPNLTHVQNASFTIKEYVQEAGEVLYVPAGWVYLAVFRTDVVLYAQRFCSPTDFGFEGTLLGTDTSA